MKKNKKIYFCLILLLLVTLSGAKCNNISSNSTNSGGKQSTDTINFSTIKKSNVSELTVAKNYTIKNNGDWKKMWEKIDGDSSNMETIDFNSEMIIVVAAGEQNSNDYSIEINDLIDYPDEIVVYYQISDFGSNNNEQMFEPFHAIKTKKSNKKLSFIEL